MQTIMQDTVVQFSVQGSDVSCTVWWIPARLTA